MSKRLNILFKKIYQFLDLLTHKEYDVLFGYNTS